MKANCYECENRIGEECSYDGHEVYDVIIDCDKFSPTEAKELAESSSQEIPDTLKDAAKKNIINFFAIKNANLNNDEITCSINSLSDLLVKFANSKEVREEVKEKVLKEFLEYLKNTAWIDDYNKIGRFIDKYLKLK